MDQLLYAIGEDLTSIAYLLGKMRHQIDAHEHDVQTSLEHDETSHVVGSVPMQFSNINFITLHVASCAPRNALPCKLLVCA